MEEEFDGFSFSGDGWSSGVWGGEEGGGLAHDLHDGPEQVEFLSKLYWCILNFADVVHSRLGEGGDVALLGFEEFC